MRVRRALTSCLVAVFLLIADMASASHFRGGDMWATIDASGRVHLFARSRWRKGA